MRISKCKYCIHYTAYYKQHSCSFSRLNKGFCSIRNKDQAPLETCENFKSNEQKEKINNLLLLMSLQRALTSINQIAQILKEKNEKD